MIGAIYFLFQDLVYFWTGSPALPASEEGFQPMPSVTIRYFLPIKLVTMELNYLNPGRLTTLTSLLPIPAYPGCTSPSTPGAFPIEIIMFFTLDTLRLFLTNTYHTTFQQANTEGQASDGNQDEELWICVIICP